MLLDLTTVIAPDHPALIWARQQDNAHIALGHVGTHLDVYECRHIWTPSRPGPSSFFAPAGSNAMPTGNPPISMTIPS